MEKTAEISQFYSLLLCMLILVFTTWSPCTVHTPVNFPKHLSLHTLLILATAKILLIVSMWHAVAINCSLNRHMKYIRQIISKYCTLLCWISRLITTWGMQYSTRLQAEWNIAIPRVVINLISNTVKVNMISNTVKVQYFINEEMPPWQSILG